MLLQEAIASTFDLGTAEKYIRALKIFRLEDNRDGRLITVTGNLNFIVVLKHHKITNALTSQSTCQPKHILRDFLKPV